MYRFILRKIHETSRKQSVEYKGKLLFLGKTLTELEAFCEKNNLSLGYLLNLDGHVIGHDFEMIELNEWIRKKTKGTPSTTPEAPSNVAQPQSEEDLENYVREHYDGFPISQPCCHFDLED